MSSHLPERVSLGERDTTERLGPDDMATLHEAQALEAAMLRRQREAARAARSTPGVCTNCGAECLPRAVYCDEDCRADHEARASRLALLGRKG